MGAAMLLSGILAAIITSPIFDRVLTHHLGLAVRIMCPIIAVGWLSLIWAGKKVLPFIPKFAKLSHTHNSKTTQRCGAFRHFYRYWGVLDNPLARCDRARR
jgi:hypothetical protein